MIPSPSLLYIFLLIRHLLLDSSINWFIFSSMKCCKSVKNACHNIPEPKVVCKMFDVFAWKTTETINR